MAKVLQGVVRDGELYTVSQVKVRLGLTDSAWRALRKRGAPVIPVGKRLFVSGRQIIQFLEEVGVDGRACEGGACGGQIPSLAVAVDRPCYGATSGEVGRNDGSAVGAETSGAA